MDRNPEKVKNNSYQKRPYQKEEKKQERKRSSEKIDYREEQITRYEGDQKDVNNSRKKQFGQKNNVKFQRHRGHNEALKRQYEDPSNRQLLQEIPKEEEEKYVKYQKRKDRDEYKGGRGKHEHNGERGKYRDQQYKGGRGKFQHNGGRGKYKDQQYQGGRGKFGRKPRQDYPKQYAQLHQGSEVYPPPHHHHHHHHPPHHHHHHQKREWKKEQGSNKSSQISQKRQWNKYDKEKKSYYNDRSCKEHRHDKKQWNKNQRKCSWKKQQKEVEKVTRKVEVNGEEKEIPESMLCPITQELMRNPMMITVCGHTFEGTSITEWLKKDAKCPICKKDANSSQLQKNFALADLAGHYL